MSPESGNFFLFSFLPLSCLLIHKFYLLPLAAFTMIACLMIKKQFAIFNMYLSFIVTIRNSCIEHLLR